MWKRVSNPGPDFPLGWERSLWSGRAAWPVRWLRHCHYHVTDFRALVRLGSRTIAEMPLDDLEHVELRQTRLQRVRGTSTIVLHAKRHVRSITFHDIRQGPQLALILELLANDPAGLEGAERLVPDGIGPSAPELFGPRPGLVTAWAAALSLLAVLSGEIVARHGASVPIAYAADDPIYPNGHKRSRSEIINFMEHEVMPFARQVLGPIKGGAEKVTCHTCHGTDAEAHEWQMPAVRALPEPELRLAGMEHYASVVDAQMRNAVYGYLAEDRNQDRAAYMRAVVMPGMARLLHRPPYDFTQTYRYNRARFGFGCYHCHMVSPADSEGTADGRYQPHAPQTFHNSSGSADRHEASINGRSPARYETPASASTRPFSTTTSR